MITIDERGTQEIKSKISMGKTALNNKKTFYQQIGLSFMEETGKVLHLAYSFI
jgi:RsiW-degrading membrane proteinase PrsW (M82 family)